MTKTLALPIPKTPQPSPGALWYAVDGRARRVELGARAPGAPPRVRVRVRARARVGVGITVRVRDNLTLTLT